MSGRRKKKSRRQLVVWEKEGTDRAHLVLLRSLEPSSPWIRWRRVKPVLSSDFFVVSSPPFHPIQRVQLGIKAPRRIQGYILEPQGVNNFTSWKVQGNLGGSSNFPDKTRGVYNEGGLFAERAGWHLPGFDDSDWEESKSPIDGISEPGVGFYRTTFDLDIPDGYDVSINVVFGNTTGAVRAQLYVNGWQYGKFVANVGPQRIFPIPREIISYNGTNTLALSLWGMGPSAQDLKIDDIRLTHDEITISSIGYVAETNPKWEKRNSF